MTKTIHIDSLGEGLREMRSKDRLKDFGTLISLTPSHICEIEKGGKLPSINIIKRYSERTRTKIILVFGDGF